MKLKILVQLWLLIFAATLIVNAQNSNPYKEIGKKGKTLTLTNGQFNEFFDEDDVQQIGTNLVNITTMKVVRILTEEEAAKRLDNTVGKRFLSVDPLTDKYPELAPYQFASNSPIANIDLDGKENLYFQINTDYKTGVTDIKLTKIEKSWFTAITPYHVFVSINGSSFIYKEDYAMDWFSSEQERLSKDLASMAKDPAAALEKLTSDYNKRKQETAKQDQEIRDIIENGFAMGRVVNAWNKSTSSATSQQQSSANNKVNSDGSKNSVSAKGSASDKTNSLKAGQTEGPVIPGSQAAPITFKSVSNASVRNFISTEPGWQSPQAMASIQKKLNSKDLSVWSEPIYTTNYGGNTYILDGHHRLKAVSKSDAPTNVSIQELSTEEAMKRYPDKMKNIQAGDFNQKISTDE